MKKTLLTAVFLLVTSMTTACGTASFSGFAGKSEPTTRVVVITEGEVPKGLETNAADTSEMKQVNQADFSTSSGTYFEYTTGGDRGFCSIGKAQFICTGSGTDDPALNAVHMTVRSSKYVAATPPSEKINELRTGQSISVGFTTCEKPTEDKITCDTSSQSVEISGKDRVIKSTSPKTYGNKPDSLNDSEAQLLDTDTFLGKFRSFTFNTGGGTAWCIIPNRFDIACTGKVPDSVPEIQGNAFSGRPVSIGVKNTIPNWGSANGIPVAVELNELSSGQRISTGMVTCEKVNAEILHCDTSAGDFWIKGPMGEISTNIPELADY